MIDWLSARAMATPGKTFLQLGARSFSFAQVDRMVGATCAVLRSRGDIRAGDHVALLLPNGLPFVLSALALMRCRAVSVPLNLRSTATELQWQFKRSDCRLLICQREDATRAADIADDVLVFPELDRLRLSARQQPPQVHLEADFAIIHTSGTTGTPKAAILTVNNIYQSALSSAFRLGVLPDDRWLCVLPLYHVGGLSIIMRSLLYGTAVELPPLPRFDVAAVNHLLCQGAITLASLAPTMLRRLLDARTRPWHPRLRLILLGGEATAPDLVQRCLQLALPIAVSYGLSEASSQVATALPASLRRKSASVGKALLFNHLRIVDEHDADLPPGAAGEILVKGGSVMRGYYGDPGASERQLRGGWLRTGDIGCRDGDGDLFVLQRRSDLIVSGGENIYPAEVENALRAHPAVAEVVVIGLADSDWGQRAAAAVQLKSDARADAAELIAFARGRIAAYKVPRELRFLEAIPRAASGKISRLAVRKAFDDAAAAPDPRASL